MGSGSIHAIAEIEKGFKSGMTIEEARDLAVKAIRAGGTYDLGSGNNIDFCIIKRGET